MISTQGRKFKIDIIELSSVNEVSLVWVSSCCIKPDQYMIILRYWTSRKNSFRTDRAIYSKRKLVKFRFPVW